MPNRIIKESINESRGLSECSIFSVDMYKRLITYVDDYGRFNSDLKIMRARLYPREFDVVSDDEIENALVELCGVRKVIFYTSSPRKEIYGYLPNWNLHQRVRESKSRYPEPDDMEVNDYYLRRFIPIDMKAKIIARDGFKCKLCGKFLTSCTDAKKFIKMGSGTFHIDHIVPCNQGGRATLENLQLTCPTCNLSRKRHFEIDEILQVAASCRKSPQVAAVIQSNSIQSESNPNSAPETEPASDRNPVIALTLNDKSEFPIFQEQVNEWADLYPAVDVIQQLRNMKGWLMANPKRRKTKSGILKFITGWLSREQDKGKATNTSMRTRGKPVHTDDEYRHKNDFIQE